ncbi:MAG: low molecular weight phosphotyrosine protein phosphatase [Thermoleophilia bacterium]|nr:low molecular weight phosphotyrosine protein phosphatase [Thermoleophilia bacterium]
MAPTRVCFVCLGNICRSPTAEAIVKHRMSSDDVGVAIEVESAGTGNWHVGHPADARARNEAARRGIPMAGVAQQFTTDDFARFDLILAMDRDNRDVLRSMAPDDDSRGKVHLLREFDPQARDSRDVPDPYFGGQDGFIEMFDMVDRAITGLIGHIAGLRPGG